MNVKKQFSISSTQEIQWGDSSYGSMPVKAIRSYYKNVKGGFNTKSPEVIWSDFLLMIEKSIEQKEFEVREIQDILSAISNNYIKK